MLGGLLQTRSTKNNTQWDLWSPHRAPGVVFRQGASATIAGGPCAPSVTIDSKVAQPAFGCTRATPKTKHGCRPRGPSRACTVSKRDRQSKSETRVSDQALITVFARGLIMASKAGVATPEIRLWSMPVYIILLATLQVDRGERDW